uniref:Uncharacterized protein n=1 Tax=Parascaris univalens TaxID=6257 RepID=A0A914ZQS6_PARUN
MKSLPRDLRSCMGEEITINRSVTRTAAVFDSGAKNLSNRSIRYLCLSRIMIVMNKLLFLSCLWH